MEHKAKNYFFYSFLVIIVSIGVFQGFKMVLPDRLFSESSSATDGIIIDSLALKAMTESPTDEAMDSINSTLLAVDSINVSDSIAKETIHLNSSDFTEGYSNLVHFYEKLHQLESTKQGKVRVAYFSDSMTDGDLIVQDIRNAYQTRFGGKGVGFVGITSLSAAARYSISHQLSKNWNSQSFLKSKKPRRSFGIDGQVAFNTNGWLKFRANDMPNLTELNNPTLFYGSSSTRGASLSITITKDSVLHYPLIGNNLLNTTEVKGSFKNITMGVESADSIPFYGVNFDNGVGVHVDNFSMRGNSGLPLSLFNTDLMNAFDQYLNYDLIVLHYGTNVLNYGTTDYTWYKNKMTEVVNHLKHCFPKADILIISVGDRAVKNDMNFATDKAVEPLVKSQKSYAEGTSSAFINLYMLMGGKGSMVNWVNANPSLANKDYTHFNNRGAKKIASMIYGELDKGYTEYKTVVK